MEGQIEKSRGEYDGNIPLYHAFTNKIFSPDASHSLAVAQSQKAVRTFCTLIYPSESLNFERWVITSAASSVPLRRTRPSATALSTIHLIPLTDARIKPSKRLGFNYAMSPSYPRRTSEIVPRRTFRGVLWMQRPRNRLNQLDEDSRIQPRGRRFLPYRPRTLSGRDILPVRSRRESSLFCRGGLRDKIKP